MSKGKHMEIEYITQDMLDHKRVVLDGITKNIFKADYLTLLFLNMELNVMEFIYDRNIPLSVPRDIESKYYFNQKDGLMWLYLENHHALSSFEGMFRGAFFRFVADLGIENPEKIKFSDDFYIYITLFIIDRVILKVQNGI